MATGQCSSCTAASDCSAPFTACGNDGCAECTTNAQCPSDRPVCWERWCGQCKADAECGAGRFCVGGSCRQACVDSACPDATLGKCIYTSSHGEVCAECATSADCAPDKACFDGACRPALEGERCSLAIPIGVTSGSAIVRGRLGYDPERIEPNGVDAEGDRDIYYRFEVTQPSDVKAWAIAENDFPYDDGDAVVELFSGTCEHLSWVASPVDTVFVPPGTYYLRVTDGPDFAPVRDFDLHLTVTPSTRVAGNSCFAPIPLPLTNGKASVTGDTTGTKAVNAEACSWIDPIRNGLVYSLHLPVESHVAFTATPLAAGLTVGVVLRENCLEQLNSYECKFSYRPGDPASHALGPLPPGDYELHVMTELGQGGPFRLDVEVTPWATNDTCETAEPLVFVDGTARVQADIRYASSLLSTCDSAWDTAAVNYRFSTVGMGERSLKIATTATGFNPEVTLAKVCQPNAASADIVHCGAYGSPSYDVPRLPEGDYFLQVTGYEHGPVGLEVTLGPSYPKPANDTCATGAVLDLSAGTAITVSGDTRGADANDYVCGAGDSRDVSYQLLVPTRGTVSLSVVSKLAGFDPRVETMGNFCGGSGKCFNSSSGGTETATYSLDAYSQPLNVAIAGAPLAGGPFDFTAQYFPPPANDTCTASAPSLALPSTTTGTLAGFYSDATPCSSSSGPDQFFKLVSATSRNVTLTLTPSGFDGVLQVMSGCASAPAPRRSTPRSSTGSRRSPSRRRRT